MRISLIAALSLNHVIGKNNQLPWHMPNDLRHFKEITFGKPIIMGRKTFESIQKALPHRRNIVITRNPHFQAKDIETFHSLETALQALRDQPEICIIGGGEIYTAALPFATHMDLTLIETLIKDGDAYFPEWNKSEWKEISRKYFLKDALHAYNYYFITLEKIHAGIPIKSAGESK